MPARSEPLQLLCGAGLLLLFLLHSMTACYPPPPQVPDDDDDSALSDDDDSATGDDDDSALSDDDDSAIGDDDDSATGDDDDSNPGLEADLWLVGVSLIELESEATFTGTEDWLIEDQNIAIHDGIIVAVTDELPADLGGAQQLDFTGQVVLPGFIDSRVHLAEDGAIQFTGDHVLQHLRAHLLSGVTTVVDGGGPEWLFDLRDRVALAPDTSGHIEGPNILAAGPFLTSSGQYPCELLLRQDRCQLVGTNELSQTDLEQLLLNGATKQPDLRALVVETTNTLASVGTGASNLNNEVLCGGSTTCGSLSAGRRDTILGELDQLSAPVPTLIYALREDHYSVAGNNLGLLDNPPLSTPPIIAQIPYLVPIGASTNNYNALPNVFSHMVSGLVAIDALNRGLNLVPMLDGSQPGELAEQLNATLPAVTSTHWVDTLNSIPIDAGAEAALDHWYSQTVLANSWQLNAASGLGRVMPYGLPVVAGSGAGSPFVPHGLSLHWELKTLKEAWETHPQAILGNGVAQPDNFQTLLCREALRAATELPAQLLGLGDRGRIEVGRRADLVVLSPDRNPLQEIENTVYIDRVFRDGRELIPTVMAVNQGPWPDQVEAAPGGNIDSVCFVDGDCSAGLNCDLLNHSCRPECSYAGALDECSDGYAPNSYCAAADGMPAEMGCWYSDPNSGNWPPAADTDNDNQFGCNDSDCNGAISCSSSSPSPRSFVCRTGDNCSRYESPMNSSCPGAEDPYMIHCAPADLDTNVCVSGGLLEAHSSMANECTAGSYSPGRTPDLSGCGLGFVCDWVTNPGSLNECIEICDPQNMGGMPPNSNFSTPQDPMCANCMESYWYSDPHGTGTSGVLYGTCR